jgi:hypothetical protein
MFDFIVDALFNLIPVRVTTGFLLGLTLFFNLEPSHGPLAGLAAAAATFFATLALARCLCGPLR